jgi:hypothetical protein
VERAGFIAEQRLGGQGFVSYMFQQDSECGALANEDVTGIAVQFVDPSLWDQCLKKATAVAASAAARIER